MKIIHYAKMQGSLQFWEKAPGQNWGKMINLTSKLGEINDIEHNKGSKIYPQNQVILDCNMPSIPLKHKSWGERNTSVTQFCKFFRRSKKLFLIFIC